jgi:CheY-like chemotaxis protein
MDGMADSDHKPKVLMLDDEAFLLEMYKLSFEKHGYEVATYYKADNVLDLLRTGAYEPDVILFDVTMPDSRSGYEFIEAVNKEGLAKRAIKIALTNEGREGAKQRLLELGMDAYMQKAQYIPSEIVAAVSELLAKRG